MEPISFASLTLGSILTMFPINGEVVTKPTITTHISPAIAGQWEIDLDSSLAMTEEARAKEATPDMQAYETNEPLAMADDGVLHSLKKVVSIFKTTTYLLLHLRLISAEKYITLAQTMRCGR